MSVKKNNTKNDVRLFKPNELIGALDQINVPRTAKLLFDYFLQFAQHKIHTGHNGIEFEVSVRDINGLSEIHVKNFKHLKTSLETLMKAVVFRDDPKKFKALVPITAIDIDIEQGLYRFDLNPKLVELLAESNYFTNLNLREFNDLESKHSIMLLQWLRKEASKERTANLYVSLSLDKVKEITGTQNCKSYANFRLWQMRVLDVAVSEINDKLNTKYHVSYAIVRTHSRKTRPKVTDIEFTFCQKQGQKQIQDQEKASNTYTELTQLEQVHARYEALAKEYVKHNFCASEAEFYRATYICDFGGLELYYKSKMAAYGTGKVAPLKTLLKDIASGQKRGRLKEQLDRYNGYIDFKPWQFRINAQKVQDEQGFLEQILINKERNNDPAELDGGWEKWL